MGFAVFTYGTDDIKYGPSVLLPLLAALIALFPVFRRGGLAVPRTVTFFSLVFFFSYLLLSTFWSSIPYVSRYFIFILGLIPLLFMAIVCVPPPKKFLHAAVAGAGLAACVVMLWTLYQFAFLREEIGNRIKHPFLDPNNLAVFLNMAFLPLLAMTFCIRRRRGRIVLGVLTFLFLVALFATNSRTGMACSIGGFLIMLPLIARQSRYPLMLAGGLVAVLITTGLASNIITDGALMAYIKDLVNFEKSASLTDRLALWHSSLMIFKDHLWAGVGLAAFYYYYPQYRQPHDNSDGYFTHMDPLQIGLETGIVGYLALYFFLLCVLFRTIRVLRLPGIGSREKLLVLAPFTGLLAVCLHMHMTFCLYLPAITIPVGVLLGWWYAMTCRCLPDSVYTPDVRVRPFLLAGFLLFMGAGILWVVQATAGMALNDKATLLAQTEGITRAETVLEWEFRISPASYYRPYEQKAQFALEKIKRAQGLSAAARRQLLAGGLEAIDHAITLQPRHGSLRNIKAMMLYAAGEDARPGGQEEAVTILQDILRIDPMMIDARLGLATILRQRGHFGQATRILEDGLRWPRPRGMPDVNYIVTTAKFNLIAGNRTRHDQLIKFANERALAYGFTVSNGGH